MQGYTHNVSPYQCCSMLSSSKFLVRGSCAVSAHAASWLSCKGSNRVTHNCGQWSSEQVQVKVLQTGMETPGRARLVALWTGRKHRELVLAKEITLSWAGRDNIMTNGCEDPGSEDRRCYLLEWHQHRTSLAICWCSLPIKTLKHTHRHICLTNLGSGRGCYLRVRHWTLQVWMYHTGPAGFQEKYTRESDLSDLSRSAAQAAGLYCMPL